MTELAKRLLPALVPLLLAGCYDNGNKEDCIGLSCPAGLDWPDGGEVRIQYIELPDGTEWRIITTFFISDQAPATMPTGAFNACGVEPTTPPDFRQYVDVGDDVTVKMGGYEMVAPKVTGEAAIDFYGRPHELAYITESFDPTTPDFFNGFHSAATANDAGLGGILEGIYVPGRPRVATPQGPSVALKRGEDLLVEWTEEGANPDVVTAGVILFLDPSGMSEPISCVGANTGTFVVPAETIDKLPASGGILQVGSAADQAVLTDDGRRIDLWGTNCVAMMYSIVE